ncbi:transposase [Ornithinibacillus californiensis]|uniref:transposase n=1 Tax=Ornithinibacillus californiensis TaxID=161536 RepID=UPI000A915563|nr:transposase [Ornithinibacillus californiensis]
MFNSTTDVYATKREVVNFSKGLVPGNRRVESKFVTQSIYGILRSGSTILKNIATALNEPIRIKNTIDRLSQNLGRTLSPEIQENYTQKVTKALGEHPVILVDDSDVIKPHGEKFEALGEVRDGSSKDNKIEKGYLVTEMVGLTTKKKQPVSLFSHIHSSKEKDYKSTNEVLFEGLNQVISSLKSRATFVFDRGYDMNALFHFMHKQKQDFIIRLKENRKLFWKGKWFKAAVLRDSRKGKIKTTLLFSEDGKQKKETVYISHLNIKVTASKNPISLILVYGLGKTPMMLATNKVIQSKEDAIHIVRTYMSRWRIEEYFRFKKQHFGFEDFRVRSLTSINNLNQLLTYAIGLLGLLADKMSTSRLSRQLIENAKALRKDIQFYYYQLAEGILSTLAYAREGVQGWFRIRHNFPRQLELKLVS